MGNKINRILMIIPTNTSGGAERVFSLLANYFSSVGIEVTLVNFDTQSNFYTISPDVNYVKLHTEFKNSRKLMKTFEAPVKEIRRWIKILGIIKNTKPSVVLPFCEMAEVLTIPACLLTHTPFCISVRNDYSAYYSYMKLLSRLTYDKAKLVVCQTELAREELMEAVDCNSAVIYNPLDKSTYDETKGCSLKRDKVIVNVGRLVPQKNQALLISSFALVADKFPEYQLIIYGEGPLREKLLSQINELGLSNRVHLKGVLDNAIKKNSDASLFVMSSDFEGFPNTLVEAMANGIPAICTDFKTGAARKLLGDNEYGWLVDVGNREQLANAISECLSHLDQAESRAKKALYVRDYLNAESICQRWIEEIEQVL